MAALEELDPGAREGADDEEDADDGSGFTLEEVLRLGGTKVRGDP